MTFWPTYRQGPTLTCFYALALSKALRRPTSEHGGQRTVCGSTRQNLVYMVGQWAVGTRQIAKLDLAAIAVDFPILVVLCWQLPWSYAESEARLCSSYSPPRS